MKKSDFILILFGILFISFNLRAPITAVGSVVDLIKEEYALSNAVAGSITTLPLIAFAVISPFVARLAGRYGHFRVMMCGLLLILAGEIIRSYTGMAGLFVGTVVLGVAIAIGNVIVPGIIKTYFSERVGFVTSVYTSGMCVFAAVGAGISMPLAKGLDLGWHHSLAVWVILTAFTVLLWAPNLTHPHTPVKRAKGEERVNSIWKTPLGWWVTLFMGVQSLIFYSLVAWLPTIVLSKGMSEVFTGNMALLFQLMAIPATLVIPMLCDRYPNQKRLVMVTCFIYAAGMGLFIIGSDPISLTLAVILMALGMGGSISLSIAFISLRTANSFRAAELSGMSQSAGYIFAALGPIATGLIYDLMSSWTIPLCLFLFFILVLGFCGFYAARNCTVDVECVE